MTTRIEVVGVVVQLHEWRGEKGKAISAPRSFAALVDLEKEVELLLTGAVKGVELPPRVCVTVAIDRKRQSPRRVGLYRDCPAADVLAVGESLCTAIRRSLANPEPEPLAPLSEFATETQKQFQKISAACAPVLDVVSALGGGSASPVAAVAAGVGAAAAVAETTGQTVTPADAAAPAGDNIWAEAAGMAQQFVANPAKLKQVADIMGIEI